MPNAAGSRCRGSPRRARERGLRPHGFRARREAARRRAVRRRADGVVAAARRSRRRRREGDPHPDARGGARARRGGRRSRHDRCDPVARRRHPDRAEGRAGDERHPHHMRLEDPRELHPALRLHGVDPPVRCRRGAGRQDELRRVRDGIVERELGVRTGAQPVEPGHGPRGQQRRVRCRRRGRRGGLGARDRHRRLGAAAGVALRRGRPQAHVRRRQPLRPDRVRVLPRHRRDVHAERARRRGALGNPRGQGPSGRHQPGRSGARLPARHR